MPAVNTIHSAGEYDRKVNSKELTGTAQAGSMWFNSKQRENLTRFDSYDNSRDRVFPSGT